MEYALLWLFLTSGYLAAAILFAIAWKRRRPLRITLALIAGGLVLAQTLVWLGLVKMGEAWHGKNEGIWVFWTVPALIYCGLTAVLLMRSDAPQSPPEKPSLTPDEEYGPLR